ncbi:SAM-dependent methyltransferase [Rugosimonospora acidiphila]|uniref:SAM-dependent methyltransferase n=1 Tax=Rugosimonospora acidiphila TaxID=556531 RepID=A0ABP9RMY6_9ACTN
MRRTVTHLARHAGIRQYLDIGTGIPTSPNAHEVAQGIAPDSRVVYVDNDPIVLAHARALLSSTPEGATAYLDADLRQPAKILGHPDLRATLDLSQPVALMVVAVLHFIPDADDPHGLPAPLIRALAPGSYVVLSHVTHDFMSVDTGARIRAEDVHFRTRAEFATFFAGLELLEPGVVSVSQWRAEDEPQPRPTIEDVAWYGGVARVP